MTPDMPPPVLEVFYASTCLPCRIETAYLAEIARGGHPALVVTLLTDETKARDQLAQASDRLAERARPAPAGQSPRDVLARAGDPDGVLPFARLTGGDGKTCATWRGILSAPVLDRLLRRCRNGVR